MRGKKVKKLKSEELKMHPGRKFGGISNWVAYEENIPVLGELGQDTGRTVTIKKWLLK